MLAYVCMLVHVRVCVCMCVWVYMHSYLPSLSFTPPSFMLSFSFLDHLLSHTYAYIFSTSYFLFIFSNCLFLPADMSQCVYFLSVSHLLLESTFAFFTVCSQQQPFDFFLLKPLCFQVFSKALKQNKLTQVLIHTT